MENVTKTTSLRSRLISPAVSIAPATLAVIIQLAAILLLFLCTQFIGHLFSFSFPLLILVITQATFAVVLCITAKMASWWRWIHGVFPFALWLMFQSSLPNELYLFGFLISLSVFWTTFRSQVPFFPSRPIVWKKVAQLIPQQRAVSMIDIGSGLGDLSMAIARMRPNSRIEGIEVAPLPWLISRLRAALSRSRANFKLGDYYTLDFADYDVVFAYLSPAAMPKLYQKAQLEMQVGGFLVSYEFEIPGVEPTFIMQQPGNTPDIYVWKM